jgi:predicted polyphosphate/ATP-dependent NAD kinase
VILRIGVLLNPLAGLGGALAQKGSDHLALNDSEADGGLGAERLKHCLARLKARSSHLELFTCGAPMGAQVLGQLGWPAVTCFSPARPCSADDTRRAIGAFQKAGVHLLLFAGGDGTARDVYDALGPGLPVLGVPTGVKMQSGVFSISPLAAAEVIEQLLDEGSIRVMPREVRDIDEAGLRAGRVRSRFYGELRVPEAGGLIQATKMGSLPSEAHVAHDMAERLADAFAEGWWIVGPGSTTLGVLDALGQPGTLLGVDLFFQGKPRLLDASATALRHGIPGTGPLHLMLTPTGGQGYLLGRGSQAISADLVRQAGGEGLVILATREKILALDGRPLLVDTGDTWLNEHLVGLYEVITGYNDQLLYPVCNPDQLMTREC